MMATVKGILYSSAIALLTGTLVPAAPLLCDLSKYTPQSGLVASSDENLLTLTWQGAGGSELRMQLTLEDQAPVVQQLALRLDQGDWQVLGESLKPEFTVTSGRRRISEQQLNPLRKLGVELTPELLEREKWYVFWDSPLTIPGLDKTNPDLPRKANEVTRTTAHFKVQRCWVETNGSRLEASFDGLTMGSFSGRIRFTVYRGTNLIRQEAIASTEEPSVAYKYSGGLKGFVTKSSPRVVWKDTSGEWQKYEFGGALNSGPVALRARNRLAIVAANAGSLAVFPPPHKFFWAREVEINLGYVWYRKDDKGSFSVGVRHGDREEMFRPYGVSDRLWEQRVRQSRRFAQGNFALYNAPPGTEQRMAVYFYLSPSQPQETREAVLEFTYQDRYKSLPGHQVMVSHYHTHFAEALTDAGTFDLQPPWIPAFRALGINIAVMSDFHGDGHSEDRGPLRFQDLKNYFEACRRHSDLDFLILPGEEANVHLGGHYTLLFPRPVYWTKVRLEDQGFMEQDSIYGQVYHTGAPADFLGLLRREDGLVWQAHPRTKGSTGYPDAIRKSEVFLSQHYLGGAFKSFPVDLSEQRLCETRCFETLDDMNNWTGPKYLVAEGDTYTKYPEDEIYGETSVNYVKLDRLPSFDEGWAPVTKALRAGRFFVTTGEVLLHDVSVEHSESEGVVVAEVEWTFPLEFAEVVWGDGERTYRKASSATDQPPFGRHQFKIPFDRLHAKWVRFAVWDSAGNGAFSQPVHLGGSRAGKR